MQTKPLTCIPPVVLGVTLIWLVLVTPCEVVGVWEAGGAPGSSDGKGPKVTLRSYAVPNHGRLELLIDRTWRDKVGQPPKELPPTIAFTPDRGSAWKVLITALWSPDGRDWSEQREPIREMLLERAELALPESVETEVELQEISGEGLFGHLTYPLTDKDLVATEPEPGDYRYLCKGLIGVSELLLVVTVLFQEKDEGVREAVVAMLVSAKQRK
jgi:hypothetical protein